MRSYPCSASDCFDSPMCTWEIERCLISDNSSASWGIEQVLQGTRQLKVKPNRGTNIISFYLGKPLTAAVFIPMLLSDLLFIGHSWLGKQTYEILLACGRLSQWSHI